MRPLAVLILVLVALAALFFALSSGEGRQPHKPAPAIQQATEREAPEEELLSNVTKRGVGPTTGRPTRVEEILPPTDPNASFEGFITGRVIDSNNYIVPNATIKLIRLPQDALVFENSISTISNQAAEDPLAIVVSQANGSFAIDNVEAGDRWGLVVSHEDYSTAALGPLMVPEKGGLPNQLVTLLIGNTLYGSVRDKNTGAPIPGAVIALTTPMATFKPVELRGPGNDEVVADEQGNYRFLNTDRSTKTLSIRAPGYATAIINNFSAVPPKKVKQTSRVLRRRPQPVAEVQEDSHSVSRQYDIELEPGKSIAGRVIAPDGSGVKGVAIQAFCLTAKTGSHGKTVTLAGGEFLLSDLGPGQYTVSATVPGFQVLPLQRVKAGTTNLEIKLVEQGIVSGRAIKDSTGQALRKFSCNVRRYNEKNISWGEVVRSKHFADRGRGSFSIDGVPAGTYVIEVRSPGLASSFSAAFDVANGEHTRDVLIRVTKGGTIRGQVVDSRSGKPMAGAKVVTNANNHLSSGLMRALGGSGGSAASRREMLTAEDGSFEFTLMTPDTYQLEIKHSGYSVVTMNDVKIGDGEETALPPIVMKTGAMLEGYVFDKDGVGIPGAYVILSSKDRSDHWAQRSTRTDSEGHYLLRNIKEGTYELSSSRPQPPGAAFLQGALDMKKSSKEIILDEGSVNVFDLNFSENKL